MAYSFQTWSLGQVLTSASQRQVEVNIRDHVHGNDGVSSWFRGIFDASDVTNAISLTVSPGPSAYVHGMAVVFMVNHGNTGPCTINVNNIGAVALNKFGNIPLGEGNLKFGTWHFAAYDGNTNTFQLMSAQSGGITLGDLSKAQGTATVAANTAFAVHQYAFGSPTKTAGDPGYITGIGQYPRSWLTDATWVGTCVWDYLA